LGVSVKTFFGRNALNVISQVIETLATNRDDVVVFHEIICSKC
jgi:hypothetical protein